MNVVGIHLGDPYPTLDAKRVREGSYWPVENKNDVKFAVKFIHCEPVCWIPKKYPLFVFPCIRPYGWYYLYIFSNVPCYHFFPLICNSQGPNLQYSSNANNNWEDAGRSVRSDPDAKQIKLFSQKISWPQSPIPNLQFFMKFDALNILQEAKDLVRITSLRNFAFKNISFARILRTYWISHTKGLE